MAFDQPSSLVIGGFFSGIPCLDFIKAGDVFAAAPGQQVSVHAVYAV